MLTCSIAGSERGGNKTRMYSAGLIARQWRFYASFFLFLACSFAALCYFERKSAGCFNGFGEERYDAVYP